MTKMLHPDGPGLAQAVQIWQQGGLVALPTETVYGLGADARNDRAVAQIFQAKGRPSFNPLIVHLGDVAQVADLVDLPVAAQALADAFWPGPMTLVLPLRAGAGISGLVTAGLGALGVRVPAHPVARDLLRAFGGPIAAPSANLSGRISPTTADHVAQGLQGRIDAIVDGGAAPVGLESTIFGFDDQGQAVVLRAGSVTTQDAADVLGYAPQSYDVKAVDPDAGGQITAPGQLLSHYAPRGQVRLNAKAPEGDEVYVGFGPSDGDPQLNLSPTGDLIEAAAKLFAIFHDLDRMGAEKIAVAPVPDRGIGVAINDRLRRAAAPR